jgi:hypothetical protein
VHVIFPHAGASEIEAHSDSVIRVGPDRAVKTLSQAARLAQDGSVVEVDAGELEGDVAVWTQDRLTLKAVGGRVRINAAGRSAEGKAIWVVRGGRITIEGFDFVKAQVPSHNGAGIRFEKGHLRIRDCTFTNNENGILAGNDSSAILEIENSEFGHNGFGDGFSHNLYVGAIARLSVTGSYFHHANVGHLLKSRAAYNYIAYNRLTDEAGGRASYELEFANGGEAYVIGNIIQQSSTTENPHLISFGAEGYRWPSNALYLSSNTLANDLQGAGNILKLEPGNRSVKAFNNVLVGHGALDLSGPSIGRGNRAMPRTAFEDSFAQDYRLLQSAKISAPVTNPGVVNGVPLWPQAEYRHPRTTRPLTEHARFPGAVQSTRQ